MRMIFLNPVLLLATVLFAGACARWSEADTITVDGAVKYQTMAGWETHARAWEEDKQRNAYDPSWAANAAAIAARMVHELGINRVQVPLRSGWQNPVDYWAQFAAGAISYTEWNVHRYEKIKGPLQFSEFDFRVETMVLPMAQALAARGEKLYVNLGVVDFNTPGYLQGTLSLAANPDEYAAFVLACFERLRTKYGITADALELVNEPENTAWNGAQMGAALVAAKARLEAAGYHGLNYIGPSASSAAHTQQYSDPLLAVPGAAQALTTLSYHRYDRPSAGTIAALKAYASGKGLKTDMSEWIDATADQLIQDLTVGNVSSWQKWAIANRTGRTNPQAFYYIADLSNPASPVFSMAPNTAFMAQYFRYVRLGAVRIAAQSSAATRLPVAFINTNGSYVVVVKTNAGTGAQAVTVSGLPNGTYGVRTVNFGEQAFDLPDVIAANGTLTLTLSEGFTAIYGKGAPAVVALVEFHHAQWDHYFITGITDEIMSLDNGVYAGWARTGRQFNGYPPAGSTGLAVCRFFTTAFAPKSSHFYTPFASECGIVISNTDWLYEGIVFHAAVPDAVGNCPAATDPVYRLYNNGLGGAPNHRYLTSTSERAQMIGQGWVPEGYGPAGVIMCSPQ